MIKDKQNENDKLNSINIQMLNSIIDDEDEKFFQLVSQITDDEIDFNKQFSITNYKLPKLLSDEPSYSSLCVFFKSEKCFHSLLSLFPEGLKSSIFNKKDKKGRQPIHFACFIGNIDILRLYYQEEYDFNVKDFKGKTPSHYAAMSETSDVIKYLFSKGIDILKQIDNSYMTPIDYSCSYGNFETFKFLWEKVKNDKYCYGYKSDLLLSAAKSGCSEIIDYLLTNKIYKSNYDYMIYAIKNGYIECVKSMVNICNARINYQRRKEVPLIVASEKGYSDIVLFLIKQKNVDINITNTDGKNALDEAISNGHLNVIKVLVENGITNNYDRFKIEDLFYVACKFKKIEIIQYLDQKFNFNYETKGFDLMNRAISMENKNLVLYLLDKKVPFKGNVYFTGQWRPFMDFLEKKGFKFSKKLLVQSIQCGNMKSFNKLLELGVELNKELIYQYDCIEKVCNIVNMKLFTILNEYHPRIKNPENCIKILIKKHSQFKHYSKPSKKKIENCLQMADIILSKHSVSDSDIINEAVKNCSIEFLELLAKYSFDFTKCSFDYSKMTTKDFMPILIFLENHDCEFQNDCFNSPIISNIEKYRENDYDVNTLLVLIRHAKNDQLIDSKCKCFYRGVFNVIDVLCYFNRFDFILDIFKKLKCAIFPLLKTKSEFWDMIKNYGNHELIDYFGDEKYSI